MPTVKPALGLVVFLPSPPVQLQPKRMRRTEQPTPDFQNGNPFTVRVLKGSSSTSQEEGYEFKETTVQSVSMLELLPCREIQRLFQRGSVLRYTSGQVQFQSRRHLGVCVNRPCLRRNFSQVKLLTPLLADVPRQTRQFVAVGSPTLVPEKCRGDSHRQRHTLTAQSRSASSNRCDGSRVFIAFGSNVGDRLSMIEEACRSLTSKDDIEILRTSGLWETQPMYVKEQESFLNGVLEARTSLQPLELLDRLQSIEIELGRRKLIDKGPRSIDLDVLLYNGLTLDHERLIIPHKLMLERGFVLHPLCELIAGEKCPGDLSGKTFKQYLAGIHKSDTPEALISPLSNDTAPIETLSNTRRTRIMSVLNVTPDSFSDGGRNLPRASESFKQTVRQHIESGAHIIDVGGESTRPDATPITQDEELCRVLPAIQQIKEVIASSEGQSAPLISIDTYHATVAEAAIKAGAHIVNDISGGTLDERMLSTVAKLGCPIILMHMRGDPTTMASKECTSYPDGLINTIGEELRLRVEGAEAAGIRRWRILLDPGIGFAKNQAQNLEILRRMNELRTHKGLEGLPWLVGSSRKGFIGRITGVETASERVWGTASTVSAAIQGGADIVRVHDVAEMVKVATMADAIWRS